MTRSRATQESIVLDRSRKVSLRRIARKPAPMLVLRTLTVKLTVNFCRAASGRLQINSLEGSLMIELGVGDMFPETTAPGMRVWAPSTRERADAAVSRSFRNKVREIADG